MPKRFIVATCLLMASLCTGALAQSLFGADKAPPPDSSKAIRILRAGMLAWNSAFLSPPPLPESTLTDVAWRSEDAKAALKELGLSEQAGREALKITSPSGAGQVHLTLTLPSDTQAAREAGTRLLEAVSTQIANVAVPDWVERYNRMPVERASKTLAEVQDELHAARAKVTSQRRRIRDVADVLDPSSQAVRGAASRLDEERQKTELELVGENARQRALQERVAQLADKAAAKASSDPIAAELEKIVKIRQDELARYKELQKQGVSATDIQTAEAQVAESRARLLERREVASRSAGVDLLADLNKELVTLSISIAENEARVTHISQRLKALSQANDLVDDLDQYQAAVDRLAKQVERAEVELQDVSRRATNAPAFSATIHWNDPVLEPFDRARQGNPSK